MASAAATASLAAAAGFDKRASTASSSLQTPGSGTFPSELLSPMAGSPGLMKRDEALKTPITPPSAYLDFLKSMSPAMMSPAPSSTSARFSFNEKSFEKGSDKASESVGLPSSTSPPTSQPALSRNPSHDSTASDQTTTSRSSAASTTTTTNDNNNNNNNNNTRTRPESPRVIIPPSPFAKPAPRSARTPRRLHIPQSPFSPAMGSAHSVPSPYSSTPLSAAPWSASFSPREYTAESATTSQPGKVSVRHVVTRTVTYCRTPLEPAPKGKRRKLEMTEDSKDTAWEERPVKQEKLDTPENLPSTSESTPTA